MEFPETLCATSTQFCSRFAVRSAALRRFASRALRVPQGRGYSRMEIR
jgi:hypothetical protein